MCIRDRRRTLPLALMDSRIRPGRFDWMEYRSACTTATEQCAMGSCPLTGLMRTCSSSSRRAKLPTS
eukprot:13448032-Heterocapsa_arctica.AAC.1